MPRPTPRFHDFIGQRPVVALLRRQLGGAQACSEPFPHTLFHGRSGVGKSMLAQAVAAEMGTCVVPAMGYDDRHAVADKLATLRAHDLLFVDECHRLGHAEQELLCEAIDHDSIPASDPKGTDRPPGDDGRVTIPPWTLVLATDQPGRLLNALLKRIVIDIPLALYPVVELKEIVEVMAGKANVLLSPQAARLIAEVANGLPRQANQILKNLRLFHRDAETRQLGAPEVREYLDAAGYDPSGLNLQEVRYLEALDRQGVSSLTSLARALGSDANYVRDQVEPAILQRGLVRITPSGRRLTDAGSDWVRRHENPENDRPQEEECARDDCQGR
jgi:Holliday junction DNA helicase RuvB